MERIVYDDIDREIAIVIGNEHTLRRHVLHPLHITIFVHQIQSLIVKIIDATDSLD